MSYTIKSFLLGYCLFIGGVTAVAAQADAIDQITNLTFSPRYEQRHHLLHGLTERELRASAQELYSFMANGSLPAHMDEADYLSLCNDIHDKLFSLHVMQSELLAHALEVIPDDTQIFVWRDYCVQKMAVTLVAEDIEETQRQEGIQLLGELTQGRIPSIQGTALIVAHGLSEHPKAESYKMLKKSEVGQRALRCAQEEDAALLDRVTALQVAAKCQATGTLDYARSIVTRKDAENAMLKISAIAAIGLLGTEEDLELMQEMSLSPDMRYRTAAQAAVKRLITNS